MIVLVLSGCLHTDDDSISPDSKLKDISTAITDNKQLWQSSNISSYTYTYSSTISDCPTGNPLLPVVITVVNGVVDSVNLPNSGIYQHTPEVYPAIEQLFTDMEEAVEEKPEVFGRSAMTGGDDMPLFDAQYGYPVQYYVDANKNRDCDAFTLSVTDFK